MKFSSIHTIVFDFDGVFTDNKVYLDSLGHEFAVCDRSDGLGIAILKKFIEKGNLDIDYFVLSTESNPIVVARSKKLGLQCFHNIGDKSEFIRNYFKDKGVALEMGLSHLLYLGNDLNDLGVMARARYGLAPADAHPRIKKIAHRVYSQKGGCGFVRAVIEDVLDLNNLTEEKILELVSNR